MKVLIFGATGMVGQGVLRETLLARDVELVQTVGRSATGGGETKLREVVHADFTDFSAIESQLSGFDACFFCLGVSSLGMNEADYTRITYDYTMAAARTLARLNPQMVFTYVTGSGTDSSERGRVMWARVKGRTENELQTLGFKAVYLFRPGAILPMHGIEPKDARLRRLYNWTKPVWHLSRKLWPNQVASTETIGLAMLGVARSGASKAILDAPDIEAIAHRERGG
ncbi:MAG: NAD-dependent epimerase/dehydratase family protein [Lysobacter sp.]